MSFKINYSIVYAVYNKYRHLIDLGQYLVGNFIGKGLYLFTFPFFVNVLSAQDVGILGLFSSTINLLLVVISSSFLFTMNVDYFKGSSSEFSRLLSVGFYYLIISFVLSIFFFWWTFDYFSNHFSFKRQFIFLLPLCTLTTVFYEGVLALIRNNNKSGLFILFNTLKSVIEISISFLLIKYFSYNWEGRAIGILISGSFCTLIFFHYAYKFLIPIWCVNRAEFVKQAKVHISTFLAPIIIFLATTSDRFFVVRKFGLEYAAIYNVAASLSGILMVFSSAIMMYIYPKLYRSIPFSWEKTKNLFILFLKIQLLSFFLVFLMSIILYNFYLKSFYIIGIPVFIVLLLSYFVWNCALFFSFVVNFYKNLRLLFILPLILGGIILLVFSALNETSSLIFIAYGELAICLSALFLFLFFSKKMGFFVKKVNSVVSLPMP
jgi:O-antigen/teichoic acid export membrane protein